MDSTVNRIFHFPYFDSDYPTSGLTVTGLARVHCAEMDLRETGWEVVDWIQVAQEGNQWRNVLPSCREG
jgi:hypothetical protein